MVEPVLIIHSGIHGYGDICSVWLVAAAAGVAPNARQEARPAAALRLRHWVGRLLYLKPVKSALFSRIGRLIAN